MRLRHRVRDIAKRQARNFKVFLTQGKFLGVYTWHYVKVDMLKLPLFQQAMKSGTLDVAQYGEILFSGWGVHPPADIRRKVDEIYG